MPGPWKRRYQAKTQYFRSTERRSADCPCMQSGKASSWIWRPAVPRWEREFCLKIGLFPWEKLVEEKKYIHLWPKVMQWDDSAGEVAFNDAKRQFWAQINHLPCNITMPSQDAYIDDIIDWSTNSDEENYNSDLLSGLERVDSDDEEIAREDRDNKEDHHENLPNKIIDVHLPIQLEDIQPTGWDDVVYTDEMDFWTGVVVGG